MRLVRTITDQRQEWIYPGSQVTYSVRMCRQQVQVETRNPRRKAEPNQNPNIPAQLDELEDRHADKFKPTPRHRKVHLAALRQGIPANFRSFTRPSTPPCVFATQPLSRLHCLFLSTPSASGPGGIITHWKSQALAGKRETVREFRYHEKKESFVPPRKSPCARDKTTNGTQQTSTDSTT